MSSSNSPLLSDSSSYVHLPVAAEESSSSTSTTRTVAVIGGGVSGLAAAWHLQTQQTTAVVHVFEKESRLGGHAWTVECPTSNGDQVPVDIGFMVCNELNYPNMMQWFKAMGVKVEKSDMSLSVSLDKGETVEWSSDGLQGLLSRPQQAFSPKFYSFVRDMLRFNENAGKILFLSEDDPRKHITVGEMLKDYGEPFQIYYLLPMMAALWSASLKDVLQFPACQLVSFLNNHCMLQLIERPQWLTVYGRSIQYIKAVQKSLGDDHVHCDTPIHSIATTPDGKYQLFTKRGQEPQQLLPYEGFDDIIFACHSDTALQILEASATGLTSQPPSVQYLKDIEYADNAIYVHSDPNLMPKKAWASWNCLGKSKELQRKVGDRGAFEGAESGFGNTLQEKPNEERSDNTTAALEGAKGRFKAVYVTYWLNRLQNLRTDTNIFVSLNPHEIPDESLTHHTFTMAHPQFTNKTLAARKGLQQIQGTDGLWFCGAYFGYGFHEDGCRSGFEVATALSGVPLPWANEKNPVLHPPSIVRAKKQLPGRVYQYVTYDLPVMACKQFICYFLRSAIRKGRLILKLNDGEVLRFGDGTHCGSDSSAVTLRIFDPWWFVKVAVEYDLGLARSYMAGQFVVEPLTDKKDYHPLICPHEDEPNITLGDPAGLTRLFLLVIGNRDAPSHKHRPVKSGRGHWYSGAFTTASGLALGKIGGFLNFIRYKLTMDNSEGGGSRRNIHAHYDLSNDLFRTFLDKETLMYSSAIYDAVQAPTPQTGLAFRGTLEEAQWRKLDTLLARAQIQPGQTMLDIGFGWGGLTIHAAKKYGCHVTGITLSVEQKALAEERVKAEGLGSLITFEVVDYRTFARRKENQGKFDRVLSCEMIEAVGHEHLGEFFWAVEQVLAHDGILVMEAITTPEVRYETYRRSTDFINSIIFPGSLCPSLHALVDAAYQQSSLTLEHIDNIGLHYAQTLAEWRRRFNANKATVRKLGFDDMFFRAWNYYFTYCEAGFFSQTENCLILVFARQGCKSLLPLCETRSITQLPALSETEKVNWMTDSAV